MEISTRGAVDLVVPVCKCSEVLLLLTADAEMKEKVIHD